MIFGDFGPVVIIESEFLLVILRLIREARATIDACCYEWSWYPGQRQGTAQGINRELVYAAKRGVKVRLMLHNESMKGHLGKVNRRTAHEFEVYGCEVRMGSTAKILHAKFWVFDGEKAVVGSHNMSQRSIKSNAEVSAVIEVSEDVVRLREYFEGLWGSRGG